MPPPHMGRRSLAPSDLLWRGAWPRSFHSHSLSSGMAPTWLPTSPTPEFGHDRWRRAQEHKSGAEGQHPDGLRWHHLSPSHRPLDGAGAGLADGDRVAAVVAFTDEDRELLKVLRGRYAAEGHLHDGGVPDGSGAILAPFGAGLRERLEDGHGGDAGAAAPGHQDRWGGQRSEVAYLVECE